MASWDKNKKGKEDEKKIELNKTKKKLHKKIRKKKMPLY